MTTFDLDSPLILLPSYKSLENPFSIDLISKNKHYSFQNLFVIEMNLSNSHKIL